MTIAFFKNWNGPKCGDTASSIVFQYLDLCHGNAVIDGFVPDGVLQSAMRNAGVSLAIVSASHTTSLELEPMTEFRIDDKIASGRRFRFPIDDKMPDGTYRMELSPGDEPPRWIPLAVGSCFPLSFHYRFQSLRLPDGRHMRFIDSGSFQIFSASLLHRALAEAALWSEMIANRTLPEWVAAATRFCYFIWRPFHRKRYWIFSDKLDNPIDSAYSIAKALVGGGDFAKERIVPFYLVDGRHSLRVSFPRELKTLRHLSLRHRLIHLAAEVNVTSEKGYSPCLPSAPYADITAWQLRVSSLHGLIHHDLSRIYGRDSCNFNLMIAGVEREAEYERGTLWGYGRDDVVCTGLPRWDDRESAPKKTICISFTWRSGLVERVDPVTGMRTFGALLAESDYRARVNALLNNPRLKNLADQYGYAIDLLPHPLMRSAISFFDIPEYVHVISENTPYADVYRDTALFVTDYSSVAMDMAYLGKPVIYYQFDHDDFYATQGYTESYFSWKDDGFGPVLTDETDVVAEIGKLVSNGCVREDEYGNRARLFFPIPDKNNGARACRAIFERIARGKRPAGVKSDSCRIG